MPLKLFSEYFCSYMLKLIYIFGHVLIVNSRCYGRCYVKKRLYHSTEYFPSISHSSRRKFGKTVSK